MKILITGGSGFIGSHLVDRAVADGHKVTVVDREDPAYPNDQAEYVKRDICTDLSELLRRRYDVVFHLAAEVGSGLSMADPARFVHVNSFGTAHFIEEMRRSGHLPRLIVASSATVYGEATYRCEAHGEFFPDLRPIQQLQRGEWELTCPACGGASAAVGIREERVLNPASIYGQSKLDTEVTALLLGRTWGFPVVAFRPFGVFGPRQSLGNPYTGVLALFATRVFAGQPINHYEDGRQNKSYIYIDDAVELFVQAMDSDAAVGKSLNMGTDSPVTIRHIAEGLTERINPAGAINPTGRYRASDTRHMWPDLRAVRATFPSWSPRISFDDGLDRMVAWLRSLSAERIHLSMNTFEKAEAYARSLGLEV